MTMQPSVTLNLDEYQRLQSGAPMSVVATIAAVAFGAGLVVGMTTLDQPASRPQPAPSVVVQSPR